MDLLDKKIGELKSLFNTFLNDELSLLDLVYLDECLKDIFSDLVELRESIIFDRFMKGSLDE